MRRASILNYTFRYSHHLEGNAGVIESFYVVAVFQLPMQEHGDAHGNRLFAVRIIIVPDDDAARSGDLPCQKCIVTPRPSAMIAIDEHEIGGRYLGGMNVKRSQLAQDQPI